MVIAALTASNELQRVGMEQRFVAVLELDEVLTMGELAQLVSVHAPCASARERARLSRVPAREPHRGRSS